MGAHHDHAHDHAGHAHDHHGHAHAHAPPNYNRAFAVGVGLNVMFVVVEAVSGIIAHSMALLADAAHNLSDVFGLVLAWGATALARRQPSTRRTYGFSKSTVLAALANALLLLFVTGGVVWEAIGRLRTPAPVQGTMMIIVAACGIVINGVSALMFITARKKDANVRAAFLHLLTDAAVSGGVVVSGVVLLFTKWTWVDPLASLTISAVILVTTWSLLKDAVNLALDAVPAHIDPDAVRGYLQSLPGVHEVHDVHIWAMSTTECALTAHLVMNAPPDGFVAEVCGALAERFHIRHSTIQVDPVTSPTCKLASEHGARSTTPS